MKNAIYGIPFITLFSAIVLVFCSMEISKKLSNFSLSKNLFSQIGKASMVIMYLHQPIQYSIKTLFDLNATLLLIITILLSYLFYLVFLKFTLTKVLFLGFTFDFKK